MNVRQNRPEFQVPLHQTRRSVLGSELRKTTSHPNIQKLENLKLHLQHQTKAKVFQTYLIEQDVKTLISELQSELQKNTKLQNQTFAARYSTIEQLLQKALIPLKAYAKVYERYTHVNNLGVDAYIK